MELFALLDVAPLHGRTFSLDDQDDNSPPVVIISESLWKRDSPPILTWLAGRLFSVDALTR